MTKTLLDRDYLVGKMSQSFVVNIFKLIEKPGKWVRDGPY